jgi:hypothetical protein
VWETILRWVDDGPDPRTYEYHLTHRVRQQDVETVRASIIEQWQLDWLDALAPASTGARRVQLRQRFQPLKRAFRMGGGAIAMQERSPTDMNSFNAMGLKRL